jgi:hypothetical protein
MALTTMYAGKINSPVTTITGAYTIGDNHVHVSELDYFVTGPNIAVLGTGVNALTLLYTAKSAVSGAGDLTGVSVLEGTDANFAVNTVIARRHTAYDYDTLRENINKLNVGTVIKLMAGSATPPETNPATYDSTETVTNKINYIYGSFSTTLPQYLQWEVNVPSTFDDSALTSVFNWTSTSAAGGNVKWILSGVRVGDGDAIDTAVVGLSTETDTFAGPEIFHTTTASQAFNISGSGNRIIFRLERGVDTLECAARILGIEIK